MTQSAELLPGMTEREPNAAPAASWLDRPLTSFLRVNWETLIWAGIFVVGLFTRLWMLGVRAMSHDESLHTLYAYYLYANGNYDHNPMMHGPFRYHLTAFMYFLFGDSDFTARLAPVLFGMGVIWMVYLLRVYIGRLGAIMAGIMVTVGPTLLFHSRYIRDDIFMAFFTLVWIYGAFRYLDRRRLRDLLIMVAGMAFGFATMENHFIHGAIIGAFFAALALWQVVRQWAFVVAAPILIGGGLWYFFHEQANDLFGLIAIGIGLVAALGLMVYALRGRWHVLRSNAAADAAVIMLTMVLPFLAAFLHVFTGGDPTVFTDASGYTSQEMILRLGVFVALCVLASVGIGFFWYYRRGDAEDGRWRPHVRHWALFMGFFWIVQVLFFTTFFTNTVQGLATGVVGSLGYWVAQQGVKRGGQPFYYYALIGWLYEFLPAFLSLCGMGTIGYNIVRTYRRDSSWDPVAPGDLPPACARPDAGCALATRTTFALFMVWWTIAAWIGYSVAGEKMPWLLTHMALPMSVLGGWWFGNVLRHIDWRTAWQNRTWPLVFVLPALLFMGLVVLVVTSGKAGTEPDTARTLLQWLLIFAASGAIVYFGAYGVVRGGVKQGIRLLAVGFTALLFVLTVRTSFTLNYINFDMATEYLIYAHAGPDIKRALAEIDTISERTVGGRNIVVAYDDESSWPMSWYMREYPNAKFYGENPNADAMAAPVIIVGPKNRPKVEPYVARDYVKRTYRLIWWPDMDYFNMTWDRLWGAITDPAQRDRLFNIIAFRKHKNAEDLSQWRDLSQWPYRHEFDMYVRRDLAPQIWDLNVLPVAVEAPNVPVILPEQMRVVEAAQIYNGLYNSLPLLSPRAVAIGPDGTRVIADTGNHRIVVLDGAGNFVRSFGSFCNLGEAENASCQDPDGDGPLVRGDGQLNEPWGVAVDAAGNVYVSDTWNGRIQVFDSQGNFLRKWGAFASTNGELSDPNALFGPRGMAIDLNGNLLVADTGNKRILRYTPNGEFIDQVGGGGVVPGRFEEPTDVAVDPADGSILVADAWNQRIQRLGADLAFQAEYAVPGWVGRDIYQKPYLAVGADGAIYATDPATAQILVFDRTGALQAVFGGQGVGPAQLTLPTGLAADLAGRALVVADGGNNRVVSFPFINN